MLEHADAGNLVVDRHVEVAVVLQPDLDPVLQARRAIRSLRQSSLLLAERDAVTRDA